MSSPRFAQSNGLAERSVQTIKNMLKNQKTNIILYCHIEQHRLLMVTARQNFLMGRKLRTLLPVAPKTLVPKLPNTRELLKKEDECKFKQKQYYDRRHRTRPFSKSGKTPGSQHLFTIESEEPTSPDEACQTNIPYVRVQDKIEYELLLHWKKLCEENVQDINKELELIRQGEKRLVQLKRKDSEVYPDYRAKIKQLQICKSDVENLAKRFPYCIKREGNVFIPLSRQECLNKLYCCLQKRFSKTRKHAKLDLNTHIQRRFGSFFEKYAFSEMKRKYFRKYFQKLGIETENLTPDLMVMDKKHRAKTIKIVIHDRIFAFKHMLGVPVLSRINEVPEILRPRPALSLLTRSNRRSTNILRKTYTISKSGLICKPDGDLTNTGHSEKSAATNSLEVNKQPSNAIIDYFVNRKLNTSEGYPVFAEDSDHCLQDETPMTKSFCRSPSGQDCNHCKEKVPAETFNDDHCIRSKQTETECPFGPVSIVDNKHCTIIGGQTKPKCLPQSSPIYSENICVQKESSRSENSCNTRYVAIDCDCLPNHQNKQKTKMSTTEPQAELTILEKPCSLTSFSVDTSSLIKRPTTNLLDIPCRPTSIEIDANFANQKRTKTSTTSEIDNSTQSGNAGHKMSDAHCLVENLTNHEIPCHETSAILDTRLITESGKLYDLKTADDTASDNHNEQIKPESNDRLMFSRGAALPRISSNLSQKSTEEIQCIVEGHAMKKRPQSVPDSKCNKTYVIPLLKITRELPPVVTQKVIKPVKSQCKQRGFDLETTYLEKKSSKDHTVYKNHQKTRPNSPVKRVRRICRTPHHVDILYSSEEKDNDSVREKPNPPLPPIKGKKDQNQTKLKKNH
ncbi:unnamed protein product [Mytilus coruscus]|uniref:Integrase catalytic domain-containing protein n=1 Tax=Mytilus coruscus TaxID=42192 RepID=A0A6J8E7L4_MYTCO|nr:unnamed protein product [Mytilus coruscus]